MRKMIVAVGIFCSLVFLATFVYGQDTVTLTVNSNYGTPDPPVDVHSYEAGTEITASVSSPVPGGTGTQCRCVGWRSKGDPDHLPPVGFANSVTFTITKNIVLAWKWKAQYLLTVNVAPVSWAGHVEVWSEDQQTPEDGYWDYKRVAQLQAVEGEGYDFAYWSGGSGAVRDDPTANPTVQQMRRPETITANFTPEPRQFSVSSAQGEPDPAVGAYTRYYDETINANCGPDPYPAGEGAQYVCTGHIGTGNVTDGPETSVSFTMTADSSVTWIWQTQYYLTVVSPYGDPQGEGWYREGTTATWSVTSPWPGETGVRYIAKPTTSGEALMDAPKTVTVPWTTQYMLIAAASPEEGGTVTLSGETWHNAGAVVSLTAAPNAGWYWQGWSGDLTGTENPEDLAMDAPKDVTANFAKPRLIVSNPQGCDTPDPAPGTYTHSCGTSVTCSVTSPVPAPVGETTAVTYGTLENMGAAASNNMGFIFTPTTDIAITKVMTIRGNGTVPVTIWKDDGTLLKTVDVPGCVVGVWTEADVIPPLELTAGTTYRIATYYGDDPTAFVQDNSSTYLSWSEDVNDPSATKLRGCESYTAGCVFPNYFRNWRVEGVCNFKYVKSRYSCTGYTGAGNCPSGSGNSVTFTINTNSSITWNWVLQHQLVTSVSPAATGTVETSPAGTGGYFDDSTVVTLTAVPSAAYIFENWSGDLSGTENPENITVDGPKKVTAAFVRPRLTVYNPSGYDTPNPAVGTYTYDRGTFITCSITSPVIEPNAQRFCAGHTGTGSCPSGPETSVTFAVDTHSSITWNWFSQYRLTTASNPPGVGTVTRSPDLTWYDEGSTVQLTATANTGYTFTGWTGDLTGTENPATITMDEPKNITADFKHAVVVSSAYGSPNPPVGTTCFPNNSSVTVSCGPTPYAGPTGYRYVCTGWTGGSGDISTTGGATSYTFTITMNSAITWTWQAQYYLTTSVLPVFPVVGGSVTPAFGWYDPDTAVELTATPSPEFAFGDWSGDLSGTDNPGTVVIDAPKNIIATFLVPRVTRVVRVTSAYGEPNPPVGATTYPDGYSAALSCGPTPYAGPAGTQYVCTGWTGGSGDVPTAGTGTSYTIAEIHQDSAITWTWKTQYQLTTAVNPAGTGSVTPTNGSWHDAEAIISCTATPSAGWGWLEWNGDLTGTENPKGLNIDGPKSITANFFKPTLTVFNPTGYDTPSPAVGMHTHDYGASVTCSVTSPAYEAVSGTLVKGFESGSLNQWWLTGGDADWFVTSAQNYSGIYSAQSGDIADAPYLNYTTTYLQRQFIIGGGAGGGISFWWKVSSESNYDWLEFYIDDVRQDRISGSVGWNQKTFPLDP